MDNASLYYEEIKTYAHIQGLLGTQEDIFIDFKETTTRNGKMLPQDKSHFSKAASGFAHQEGGVIVWGIKARKDEDEVDQATELIPIENAKIFFSELNGYTKQSTEPVVNGIKHRLIFENEGKTATRGFVVSLFPKSNEEHRALGRTKADFYRRHGDSFVPLSTSDIRALFFRSRSPDLELIVSHTPVTGFPGLGPGRGGIPFCLRLSLTNCGGGIAKSCSVHIWLRGKCEHSWYATNWGDGRGGRDFSIATVLDSPYVDPEVDPRYTRADAKHIKLVPGAVICPQEKLNIATVLCRYTGGSDNTIVEFDYKIFAESMVTKEGKGRVEIKFPSNQ